MERNKKNIINLRPLAATADKEIVLKAIITTSLLHFKNSMGTALALDRISKTDCPNDMESLKAYKTDRHLRFFVDALCNAIFAWHKIFF